MAIPAFEANQNPMMPFPIFQIFRSHLGPFFVVTCVVFFGLAFVAFTLPKRAAVRSSLEIGYAVIGDKQEPFDTPDQVAKRLPNVYGPAALLAMANNGASPSVLAALQSLNVESIGRSIVLINVIDPRHENEAKQFQEIATDLVIKDLAPRTRALRDSIAARFALAKEVFDNLQKQISNDVQNIEHIKAVADEMRSELEKQRTSLITLYQRAGTAAQSSESAVIEARIRELHEQISSQTNMIAKLELDRSDVARNLDRTRRMADTQAKSIAEVQFEQNSFSETRRTLPPTLIPASSESSRNLKLILMALAASLLAGFGAVVLLHKFSAREL